VDLKPGLDKVLCQSATENSSRADAMARLRTALASTGATA
jgi:hypothetical protein